VPLTPYLTCCMYFTPSHPSKCLSHSYSQPHQAMLSATLKFDDIGTIKLDDVVQASMERACSFPHVFQRTASLSALTLACTPSQFILRFPHSYSLSPGPCCPGTPRFDAQSRWRACQRLWRLSPARQRLCSALELQLHSVTI